MKHDYENSTDNFGRSSFNIILKSKVPIDNIKLKKIVGELLSNIGSSCTHKEGTIIGHIKCYIKTTEGFIKASLVSMKTGPKIVGDVVNSVKQAEFALACIIFGLTDTETKKIIQEEYSGIQKKYGLLYKLLM